MRILVFLIIFSQFIFSQNLDLNQDFIYDNFRYNVLNQKFNTEYSFTQRPINYSIIKKENSELDNLYNYTLSLVSNKNKTLKIDLLPMYYGIEFNSNHPYNRNNGSMIPNRGYQHLLSMGLFLRAGPLTIKINPEHHFSENKNFDGFWEGHYPVIWAARYDLWNHIDMPERFGEIRHNKLLIGQSSIRLNWKKISLGVSNENIWWGPSIRNSIMMSNHAQGFRHITFNTIEPIKTFLGNFEWQLITGELIQSGYTPPRTDFEYAGTKLYIPKINQNTWTNDWRYLQGYTITFSPKIIKNLSLGFIRWVQMYHNLVDGKYWWMEGNPTYFPVFANIFRKNDKYQEYEQQTNQAAGIFLRWMWEDSKAEFYFEYHYNDAKQNLRDLLLDTDHSRAVTMGMQKIFKINKKDFLFSWEWTQMEQNASRLIRGAGSWYEHGWVYDGYTNRGEVLGSGIGPGSNSQFFSIQKINENNKIGISFEIIDHDNDFYHNAFASAKDYRRYWKDFNLHFNLTKKLNPNLWISSNLIYSRSLNYQWELDDYALPYYHAGRDVNNFHITLKFSYLFNKL